MVHCVTFYLVALISVYINPSLCQEESIDDTDKSPISLDSPWMIVIGSLLTIVLCFNIAMMIYVKYCNKNQIVKISFNESRRSGYESVKHIDSEDFSESDANIMHIDGI